MITIGVVDNDRFALQLLAKTLEQAAVDFHVLWAVSTGAQAIHHCLYGTRTRPDVLLLDMSLTDMKGTDVSRAIREQCGDIAILGITSYEIRHYQAAGASAGLQMLIRKDVTPLQLEQAVRAVASGYVEEGFSSAEEAHNRLRNNRQANEHIGLTKREQQVLELYLANYSTHEIADRLHISTATVFVVMHHIKAKLGGESRAEILRKAKDYLDNLS